MRSCLVAYFDLRSCTMIPDTPQCSKAAPPKFKQKETRQFKSKAPKAGQKGFDNDVPGMDGLGDSAVVCPWEAFGDMELSDLAQFGIV
uniref:3',5'-cyclic-GMP phosphodiesterase n=1 Tax=Lates calcarifer TaxID=8187 RepID=A0A4W6CWX3_LATCA